MQAHHSQEVAEVGQLAGKYLTFCLDAEVYGLEILRVREIIGLMDITPVPRTPDHIRGVINLRGKIIPVVDLRLMFGLDSTPDSEQTCIIVVDITTDDRSYQLGLLVDAVSEVLDINQNQIEPAPEFGSDTDVRFIDGLAKTGENVTLLLNIETALCRQEISQVASRVDGATIETD